MTHKPAHTKGDERSLMPRTFVFAGQLTHLFKNRRLRFSYMHEVVFLSSAGAADLVHLDSGVVPTFVPAGQGATDPCCRSRCPTSFSPCSRPHGSRPLSPRRAPRGAMRGRATTRTALGAPRPSPRCVPRRVRPGAIPIPATRPSAPAAASATRPNVECTALRGATSGSAPSSHRAPSGTSCRGGLHK